MNFIHYVVEYEIKKQKLKEVLQYFKELSCRSYLLSLQKILKEYE